MATLCITTILFVLLFIIGNGHTSGTNEPYSHRKRFLAHLAKFFNKFSQRKTEQCNREDVDSMTNLFHYKSLKNKREQDVHEKIEGFMAGANGEIHIGYIGAKERCVAIKLLDIGDFNKKKIFENAYTVMNKMQKKLAPKDRKHIIELFEYGTTLLKHQSQRSEGMEFANENSNPNNGDEDGAEDDEIEIGVLIMELGTGTFGNKIYSQRSDFRNDREFIGVAKEIVMPLRELHQVAMHLDYKPDNLVYVESVDKLTNFGSKLLKVIDFDGTYLLPEAEHKSDNAKRANFVAKNLKILTGTDRYNAPEFYVEHQYKQFSTKTDMWAAGMMVYEVLFLQAKYKIFEEMGNDITKFNKFLFHINEIHRGFTCTKDIIKYEKHPISYSAEWLTEQRVKFLTWIFRVWNDFPYTTIMITNLLNPVPPMRLSAKGVLDFVDGKCFPTELNGEKLELMEIFDGLSVADLVKNIKAKRAEMANSEEGRAKLEKLQKLLEKAVEKRWETIEKLRNSDRWECDTETTEGI